MLFFFCWDSQNRLSVVIGRPPAPQISLAAPHTHPCPNRCSCVGWLVGRQVGQSARALVDWPVLRSLAGTHPWNTLENVGVRNILLSQCMRGKIVPDTRPPIRPSRYIDRYSCRTNIAIDVLSGGLSIGPTSGIFERGTGPEPRRAYRMWK